MRMIKQNYVGFETLSPLKVLDNHYLLLQCRLIILTLFNRDHNISSPKPVLFYILCIVPSAELTQFLKCNLKYSKYHLLDNSETQLKRAGAQIFGILSRIEDDLFKTKIVQYRIRKNLVKKQ